MTNICRCGTYQRIRAAVHMAAGGDAPPAAGREGGRHEKNDIRQRQAALAPQVHRRLGGGRRRRPRARLQRAVRARAGAERRAANEVNVWVAIKPDDTCVIRIARSEMGQGTLTGLAQLVAEELECDWSKVTTEGITPGRNLASKRAWGDMSTGGSRGIRTSQDYVRRGGAAARMMLLQAAADQWKVPVGELTVSKGVITPRGEQAQDQLRQGRGGGREADAAGSEEHQAQGPEGLEDRRQAAEAARHRRQAQRQQGLRDRRQAAGHAVRRDQGLPGVRRQGEELRRSQGRRHARRQEGGEGQGHRRRRRRRHLVARQDGARCAADRLGRGRATPTSSSATIAEQLKEGLTATDDQRRAQERRCAEGDRRGGEEGRGGLFDAVPVARLHGDDERHGAAHGRQGRVLGADAEPRSLARGAVGGLRHAARASARSTATTSAAASAGAAARRTTCTRRWRSPRNSPASRSS